MNELDKVYFQHDMAYGKYKGLVKRTRSDNIKKFRNCKQFKIWWISKRINFNGL